MAFQGEEGGEDASPSGSFARSLGGLQFVSDSCLVEGVGQGTRLARYHPIPDVQAAFIMLLLLLQVNL